ncbi:16S rRNA (adenine(1518)-N(6)/adenine(1519)-N(6))-dimethyltransferase RsmA [Candidatus Darwinibacter acetoxidans]|nr:16S rRNA (adenine(1518)-N(6)/adenine(1519)-N(6))-dimethyltransferase RsmA [Bacillota bacterium]
MSHVINPSHVARVMKEKGISAKKSLGQNFLIDQNIVRRIVESADLQGEHWVVEIGPGLGALTAPMAEAAAQVVAMEIDRELVAILQEALAHPKISIVEGDALELDWRAVLEERGWRGEPLSLVANLPYYITTPLIMKALESGLPFAAVLVMVQKEVADRMLAPPGSKDCGVLSLAVQYYAEGSLVLKVPRTVFIPAPAVDSAVVKLVPRLPQVSAPRDQLFQVIRAAFQQRRKTLRNALKSLVEEWGLTLEELDQALANCGIEPSLRGERLSLEQYSKLTEELLKGV